MGCSSSGGGSADCGYFQDSANVLLDSYYELDATPVPKVNDVSFLTGETIQVNDYKGEARKRERLAQILGDWSMRVLEAPEGCFPASDLDKAKRTPKP
jgi:hypothetical protein